ncbi:MAG: hypothetical protein JWM87_2934 [Candidatus Eremiobacteraeota bacterium]|nr:hypothetical protein [Candidatus Eremiobacteraeota bacterium]
MKQLFASLAAAALLAAPISVPAATPAPSASPAAPATLTVVCQRAPLYVFQSGTDRPMRARTPDVTMGQRFELVSGPRTTLESFQFYETNIAVVEPGYPANAHYWISRDCAIPSR